MSLVATRIEYVDFRNMERRALEPDAGLTVLVGPNAVGKTNCIEGVYLVTTGKSFRHTGSVADFVRQGASGCSVSVRVEGTKRVLDLRYEVSEGKKRLLVNDKSRRLSEGSRILPSVLFYPDDLMVIKGPASGRRALVDDMGCQLNEAYARVYRDYSRALTQRNALLRDDMARGELFDAWTESLVHAGSVLYLYRRQLLDRLTPHIRRAYGQIAPGEELGISYESSYASADMGRGQVEESLRSLLAQAHGEEVARRTTVYGPHKDDVEFSIDGRSARMFGSQGQQRSISLAEKIAHVNLVWEIREAYPIFLLDDVMSELDATRRQALFSLIHTGVQTIMTTTNLEYFTKPELERVKVVRMGRE